MCTTLCEIGKIPRAIFFGFFRGGTEGCRCVTGVLTLVACILLLSRIAHHGDRADRNEEMQREEPGVPLAVWLRL